jgi:hypothetical protein
MSMFCLNFPSMISLRNRQASEGLGFGFAAGDFPQ